MDLKTLFSHSLFQCDQQIQICKDDICLEDCRSNATGEVQATAVLILEVDTSLPGKATI